MVKELFSPPLTDEEQYWAGFIHADGCIQTSTVSPRLTLTQGDIFVIEEFLRFIGQTSKITSSIGYEYGFGRSNSHRASTTKGVKNLIDLGVKGEICSSLYRSRHFWRGLIDGDGSVFLHKTKPKVWLCSGKPRDVEAFCSWIGELFGDRGPTLYRGKTAWYGAVTSTKAKLLGLYLYKDSYSAVLKKQQTALSYERVEIKSKIVILAPSH